jgi:hypothetical protein
VNNLKNQCYSKFAVLAIIFSLAFLIQPIRGFTQGIGISSTAITPDVSAVLEMRSTNQGVLVPRMTITQRDLIPSPSPGLMIYNTTSQAFNYYQGGWKALASNLKGGNGISVINSPDSVTISNSIPILEATSSSTTLATNTSYVSALSISAPSSGNFMVWFSTQSLSNTKANSSITISLFYNNGTPVPASERIYSGTGEYPVATQAYIQNVVKGQTIDLKCIVSGNSNSGTMGKSTLTIMQVK